MYIYTLTIFEIKTLNLDNFFFLKFQILVWSSCTYHNIGHYGSRRSKKKKDWGKNPWFLLLSHKSKKCSSLLLFPLSVAYSLDKWRHIYLPSFKSNLENASIKHKVVIIPPFSRTVHEVDCYLKRAS